MDRVNQGCPLSPTEGSVTAGDCRRVRGVRCRCEIWLNQMWTDIGTEGTGRLRAHTLAESHQIHISSAEAGLSRQLPRLRRGDVKTLSHIEFVKEQGSPHTITPKPVLFVPASSGDGSGTSMLTSRTRAQIVTLRQTLRARWGHT